MGGVADMQDQIGLHDLFQRRPEGGDQIGRQFGHETDRVRQDEGAPRLQRQSAHRRVEGGEQPVFGRHRGARQAVEQGGFASVRIADENDDGKRHAPPGGAMQAARAGHRCEFPPQPHDPFVDPPPVHLELRFAGAADEPQPAALPLQMRPAADQAAALIGQRRQLHLQAPFPRARPRAEDLKDQGGPVQHLDAPRAFEIALLDRRERRVHDHDARALRRRVEALRKTGNLPGPEKRRRARPADRQHVGAADPGRDRPRQTHGLLKPRLRASLPRPRRLRPDVGMQDPRAVRSRRKGGVRHSAFPSSPPGGPDRRTGRAGTTVDIACL